jgi:hypothetical protein
MFSLGAIAVTAVDPVIAEFSFTVGSLTELGSKDALRGYRVSALGFGFGSSISPTEITVANGHTADLDTGGGYTISFMGSALYERDPNSGGANSVFLSLYFPTEPASVPANTDANFFKSLRIINNADNTEATIQRSDMTFASNTDSTGTGYSVSFYKTQTINMGTSGTRTIQLRSD